MISGKYFLSAIGIAIILNDRKGLSKKNGCCNFVIIYLYTGDAFAGFEGQQAYVSKAAISKIFAVGDFLSYSSRNVLIARQIHEDMRSDAKVEVWFDLAQPGESPKHSDHIKDWLKGAICESRGFVLLLTRSAMPLLHAGFYYFSPAVADGTLAQYEMCDWIDNACAIEVIERATTYGHMRIPMRVRATAISRETSQVQ